MDHYRTLQVTRDAEPEVVERAYKALSRKYHPDRAAPGDHADANRRMQAINEAYRVLRDPDSRRAYDAVLPPERPTGWDVFWERGLVGLFIERYGSGR
jgi:DnaJ-class molecular chaperone